MDGRLLPLGVLCNRQTGSNEYIKKSRKTEINQYELHTPNSPLFAHNYTYRRSKPPFPSSQARAPLQVRSSNSRDISSPINLDSLMYVNIDKHPTTGSKIAKSPALYNVFIRIVRVPCMPRVRSLCHKFFHRFPHFGEFCLLALFFPSTELWLLSIVPMIVADSFVDPRRVGRSRDERISNSTIRK